MEGIVHFLRAQLIVQFVLRMPSHFSETIPVAQTNMAMYTLKCPKRPVVSDPVKYCQSHFTYCQIMLHIVRSC